MGSVRSPVLGFNHNVQHLGIVFHVQTEDSGVDNPHIITHLFHGGVILATRKLNYDPGSDAGVVKSLMQSQHKAILKDLKRGDYNEKIQQYFPDKARAETKPAEVPPPVAVAEPEIDSDATTPEATHAIAEPGAAAPDDEPTFAFSNDSESPREPNNQWEVREPALGDTPAKPGGEAWEAPGTYTEPAEDLAAPASSAPASAAPTGKPQGKKKKRKTMDTSPGVVVAAPSVIVNAPSRVIGDDAAPASIHAQETTPTSIFGKDVVSEKSLDEVILAYLDEDSKD